MAAISLSSGKYCGLGDAWVGGKVVGGTPAKVDFATGTQPQSSSLR
jgi:hypothetical protein